MTHDKSANKKRKKNANKKCKKVSKKGDFIILVLLSAHIERVSVWQKDEFRRAILDFTILEIEMSVRGIFAKNKVSLIIASLFIGQELPT